MATIFTKPFEDITYSDVEEMVEQGIPESEVLEYKEKLVNPKRLAELVSAFANTYGGYVIFGVSEKEGKNEPEEIVGVAEPDKVLDAKVTSACYDNIMPPVFVRTQVLSKRGSKNKIYLVYIPESDLTPHAVDQNTTVYVRVRDQKRPEERHEYQEKASISRVEWLKTRRARHIELRANLIENYRERLDQVGPKRYADKFTLDTVVMPKFPRAQLVKHETLHAKVDSFLKDFQRRQPTTIIGRKPLIHYDGGLVSQANPEGLQLYLDFNSFGLCGCRITWDKFGDNNDYLKLDRFGLYLVTMLSLSFGYLASCDFVGSASVSSRVFGLRNTNLLPDCPSGVSFSGLFDGVCRIEESISHEREYPWAELKNSVEDFVRGFTSRIIFAYGVRSNVAEYSAKVFEDGMARYKS